MQNIQYFVNYDILCLVGYGLLDIFYYRISMSFFLRYFFVLKYIISKSDFLWCFQGLKAGKFFQT